MAQPPASFAEAIRWLDDHIDYERVAPTRRELPSLDAMTAALELLGNPAQDLDVIHVTGTNGKGSTSAMISSVLVENGLLVGTYTSPNLHVVNERIAIDGQPIGDDAFAEVLSRLALVESQLSERLTRFELLTLAAICHFADEAVEAAVIEVGMGGTWDCTNVVDGRVAVLTTVALDHVQVLGSTEVEIATDKSGIIKPGALVVVGRVSDEVASIVEERTRAVGALDLWRLDDTFSISSNRLAFGGRLVDIDVPGGSFRDLLVPLHGIHQGDNAAVALAAATAFLGRAPSDEVAELGLAAAAVPGRLEVLGHLPLLIVDGAHNAAGSASLAVALDEGFHVPGPQVCVLGMLEGRDPIDLLGPLAAAGIRQVVCVAPDTPRAMATEKIAQAASELGLDAEQAPSIEAGVDRALSLAGSDGMVLATGSLYVVGDARIALLASNESR